MRLRILFITCTLIALCGCRTTSSSDSSHQTIGSAEYQRAAVAADHPLASQAGFQMLRRGGNAVDAAVATSFCLSVVRPYSCGIGGGGFMLVFFPEAGQAGERAIAINYRETCPSTVDQGHFAAHPDPNASRFGPEACAVPGTVAGLTHALEKYGTLDLATVLAPAIRAAEEGFPADEHFVTAMRELEETLQAHPEIHATAEAVWVRVCRSGSLKVGDMIRQPDQARALRLIASKGKSAFYGGEIADAIVEATARPGGGGGIAHADLRSYTVRERAAMSGRFRNDRVYVMPPPSSGGLAMLQVLGILERRDHELRASSHNGPDYVHLLTESLKHAFADRAEWLADPQFVDVPVEALLDGPYLDKLASRIDMNAVRQPFEYGTIVSALQPPPDAGTSHFCVIDQNGMAVACTETINLNFGSLVTVPGFGFVLNNEMDDFTTRPGEPNAFGLRQSIRNLPQPGKRPLSSMSPTILVRQGRAHLIVGASGGPRIITGSLQCLLACLLFDLSPAEAVAAPRFHHQWLPDVLMFEPEWQDLAMQAGLARRGHAVGTLTQTSHVQIIRVLAGGAIQAACDPRKGGAPAGE